MSDLANGAYTFSLLEQTLVLLPEKAIIWKEKGILLVADVHLGKVNHFRKSGIAVPQTVAITDYPVLDRILNQYTIQEVVFLGDLFHSQANHACVEFSKWVLNYQHIRFTLVKGNHDILPKSFYDTATISLCMQSLLNPPFIFSHTPLTEPSPYYTLCGHIHPAVTLYGKGKQVLTLPCFYFGKSTGILPAFGSFTGKAIINPEPESRVFAIAGTVVKRIN
ncbi:ligase-associated DNA damage response endonuclease PdeM [Rhodocytophaga aerolata]|uniref:Ligase-associated DNA damage response endonuclease PdeM n=1 Tax=Rhodocytophaga aerolata TaxID=455078 RepID=A0ABT8RHR5_9BACT|nr:ligase-associated DNA damage response endonuclease PdeM [Rhodocytophaga aerolata]MDO1450924.1 ligase-associated DNA damage response endonuclease PdeM [Rhodocytophaga aerolata]